MYSDPCYKLLDNVHFLLTNVSVEIKFICPNGYIKKKMLILLLLSYMEKDWNRWMFKQK